MIVDERMILDTYHAALETTGDEDQAHRAAEKALAKMNPEIHDRFLIGLQVAVILAARILSGDLQAPSQQRARLTPLPR